MGLMVEILHRIDRDLGRQPRVQRARHPGSSRNSDTSAKASLAKIDDMRLTENTSGISAEGARCCSHEVRAAIEDPPG